MNQPHACAAHRLGEALGDIARALQAEPDVSSTLAAIIEAAADHLEGAEEAGISLVEHRDTIGMATGILMQRHDLDPVQAFRMPVDSSQHANMKLHQVAAWLVEHRRDL
ncbi:ANTAR domain-containing protein [Amycolatopsis sp. CA-128772]|uniref:ANTAR domain-containing protein n=1 Tax=Amycolatopsis sp. CA-128772 TaxID=2073159 RepID=UPI000CD102A2|nr:ANTAR domain-containing protein [Amycolatopsis sp. CA-128772]